MVDLWGGKEVEGGGVRAVGRKVGYKGREEEGKKGEGREGGGRERKGVGESETTKEEERGKGR